MKRVYLFVIIVMITAWTELFSMSKEPQFVKLNTIDSQINYLLDAHQKYMNQLFLKLGKKYDAFDISFFTDNQFMNDEKAKDFFKAIAARIEKGSRLKRNTSMMVSYTAYHSINGKVTGIDYKYIVDGKNITLIKGTYNNGYLLKAVYYYDMKGRLLNAQEFRGNKLINQNAHKLEI